MQMYLSKSAAVADTSKLFVCPTFDDQSSYSPYSGYSYRYNAILGGDDPRRAITTSSGTIYVPFQINHIKQSSNMAMIIEGGFEPGGTGVNAMVLSFSNDSAAGGTYTSPKAAGTAFHSPFVQLTGGGSTSYSVWVAHKVVHTNEPLFKQIMGTSRGLTGLVNVGFCDGSVRAIPVSYQKVPFPAWPDVYIDPYHPQPQW
jgi:prepilin-type processing-associated H-X9-DG protein